MRQTPGQFERGANLGGMLGGIVLHDVDGGDHMPEPLEVAREPGPEQVVGAGAAAPTAMAGIVWHEQKLNIHGTKAVPRPSGARRQYCTSAARDRLSLVQIGVDESPALLEVQHAKLIHARRGSAAPRHRHLGPIPVQPNVGLLDLG
jgi:hypothetical protein